jgi:hypothetical protein
VLVMSIVGAVTRYVDERIDDGGFLRAPIAPAEIRYCISPQARIRDAAGKPVKPFQVVPLRSYVAVLETATIGSTPLVRVALLPAHHEVGWIAASNLMTLVRPARPSTAAVQMAKLLASASHRALEPAIVEAGGYGDILDPYQDERFERRGGSAVKLADVVEKYGAEALDLEPVGGRPEDARPGTLLVTRGNGELAVISHVRKGCVVAFHDGKLRLIADPTHWAMYRPIDRE